MKKIVIAFIICLFLLVGAGAFFYKISKKGVEELVEKKSALENLITPLVQKSQTKKEKEQKNDSLRVSPSPSKENLDKESTDQLMKEVNGLADDLDKDLILDKEPEVDFQI